MKTSKVSARQQKVVLCSKLSVRTNQTDTCELAFTEDQPLCCLHALDTAEPQIKANLHVSVYRFRIDVRSMVLSSSKTEYLLFQFWSMYFAERPQHDDQLPFLLHELVFFGYHSQFASYS